MIGAPWGVMIGAPWGAGAHATYTLDNGANTTVPGKIYGVGRVPSGVRAPVGAALWGRRSTPGRPLRQRDSQWHR